MARLPKLRVRKQALTHDDLIQIGGLEDNWFARGSWLCQTAEAEFAAMAECTDRDSLYVGLPIAALIRDADLLRDEREITAAMLYSMAVECWLKGLIIMAMPRKSRALYMSLKERYQSLIPEGLSYDAYKTRANAIDRTPEIKRMRKEYYALRRAEDAERHRVLSRQHRHHRLRDLAEAAKIKSRLAAQDLNFLDMLTKANQLGRYPVPLNPDMFLVSAKVIGDKRRRDRINKVLHNRYHVLLHGQRKYGHWLVSRGPSTLKRSATP
jgi:hypothetical protein